jgi:ATP-dependent DNA helicase RecQ
MVFEVEDKLLESTNFKEKPRIFYHLCSQQKICLDISGELLGIKATYYHGGLSSKRKDKNMLWMNEAATVIVATNAFGMELTKPM